MTRVQAGAGGSAYAKRLLLLYLACWAALAIAPWYRADWALENVLVLVALPILFATHRLLSRGALTAVFVFMLLHAVGAHYTYAEVPYDAWWSRITGHSLNSMLGLERNHFDRMVHFMYGLLVTPAMIELLDARIFLSGFWRYLIPFTFMAAQAGVYEIIEWAAAEIFGGDLGQAYLGTQGDEWDSQKDSALMMVGAVIAIALVRRLSTLRRKGILGGTGGVGNG